MNYDKDYLGSQNDLHPSNIEENEIFESNNISECLEYAKDFKDFEPLENAILHQETIIEKAILDIQFLIDCTRYEKNLHIKNNLIKLRTILKTTQIKQL